MNHLKTFSIPLIALLLSACGGGNDSTSISTTSKAADINSGNTEKLATAATEGARQALLTDSADVLSRVLTAGKTTSKISDGQTQQAADTTATISLPCASGSASGSYDLSTGSGSFIFNNCDLSNQGIANVILNGSVNLTSAANIFTFTYSNFTVSYNGVSQPVDLTVSCTGSFSTSSSKCSTSSSSTGIDGRSYTIQNFSVQSDGNNGFNISALVSDPDYGQFSITSQSINYNCTGSQASRPGSGSINISSKGKTASITFDSCSTYTVTLDGVATSYSWPIIVSL